MLNTAGKNSIGHGPTSVLALWRLIQLVLNSSYNDVISVCKSPITRGHTLCVSFFVALSLWRSRSLAMLTAILCFKEWYVVISNLKLQTTYTNVFRQCLVCYLCAESCVTQWALNVCYCFGQFLHSIISAIALRFRECCKCVKNNYIISSWIPSRLEYILTCNRAYNLQAINVLYTAFKNMPFLHVEEALLEARKACSWSKKSLLFNVEGRVLDSRRVKIIYKKMGRSEGVVV